jgi:hypothetical protein
VIEISLNVEIDTNEILKKWKKIQYLKYFKQTKNETNGEKNSNFSRRFRIYT